MYSFIRKTKWHFIVGGVVVIVLFSCFFPPPKPSKMRISQKRSEIQLRIISELILTYKNGHDNENPKGISMMIADDALDTLQLFQAPNNLQFWKPVGWETNQTLINTYSDYVMCPDCRRDIVAFERPGIWSDQSVAVCFTNLVKSTMLTIVESATGATEKVSEKYELKIERYPLENFKKLFNLTR